GRRPALHAAARGGSEGRATHTGRWADRVKAHVRVATALLERVELPVRATEPQLIDMLVDAGDPHQLNQRYLSKHVRKHGSVSERTYVTQQVPLATSSERHMHVWRTRRALRDRKSVV